MLRRATYAILTLWLTLTVAWLMVRAAPGGPFTAEKALPAEIKAQLEATYGLKDPLWVQYGRYFGGLLQGDFGVSVALDGRKVADLIAQAFPVSVQVGALGLLWAVAGGVPLGLYWAHRGKIGFSRGVMLGTMLPSFVAAPLLQQGLLACGLPAYGYAGLASLVAPSVVLGLYYLPFVARLTQVGFEHEKRALYLRVAQSKGLTRQGALFKHAWRTALSPVLAYLAPTAAGLITGSFVVETVFGLPGLGRFFVNAVFSRDDTLLLGLVAFYTMILVGFNLCVESLLVLWNPAAQKGEGDAN